MREYTQTPVKNQWQRIRGRCPVCGHRGWCTQTADGAYVNCPRTDNGRPIISRRHGGLAGFLHALNGRAPAPAAYAAHLPVPGPHIAAMAERFRTAVSQSALEIAAAELGLSPAAMARLAVGRARDFGMPCANGRVMRVNAWAFPMRAVGPQWIGPVCGIRFRFDDGKKLSMTGGHEGLFIPVDGLPLSGGGALYADEGPTSTAALLGLGLAAVGRPNCSGGTMQLANLLRIAARMLGHKPALVLVANNDREKIRPDGTAFWPGQDGAKRAAHELAPLCQWAKVIVPPCKDSRDWARDGATAAVIEYAVRNAKRIR